jgi:hypothetical protein
MKSSRNRLPEKPREILRSSLQKGKSKEKVKCMLVKRTLVQSVAATKEWL